MTGGRGLLIKKIFHLEQATGLEGTYVVGRGLLIRCDHLGHLTFLDHGRLIQVLSLFGTEKRVVGVVLDRARLIQVHYI